MKTGLFSELVTGDLDKTKSNLDHLLYIIKMVVVIIIIIKDKRTLRTPGKMDSYRG